MSQRLLTPFAVVVCLLFASVASAQTLKDGEFTVQRFAPAPGPRNFVTVEGARTDGDCNPSRSVSSSSITTGGCCGGVLRFQS